MRVLIVGSGGREHALGWRLARDSEVHAAPGNPGLLEVGHCHPVPTDDHAGLVGLAERLAPDVVIVGPEAPLIGGLAEVLRGRGLEVLGPSRSGARLEASKSYAKAAMARAGVPTAYARTFGRQERRAALEFARERASIVGGVAVKASGPALGKGVVVCSSPDEAEAALAGMLREGGLGSAADEVVIEDRLAGSEFSLLSLVNERGIVSLPAVQDWKRLRDGDEGPNTGGMGSACPPPWLTDETVERAEDEIVRPILAQLEEPYRGVLFSGIMVVEGRPFCLEYNVRFGDPETQSVARLVGSGFAEALLATARGEPIPPVERLPGAAVTVVMASRGYPDAPERGSPIDVGDVPEGVVVFHAGTSGTPGRLVAAGGRVLGVSAAASDAREATRLAYRGVAAVSFRGAQFRRDIGFP